MFLMSHSIIHNAMPKQQGTTINPHPYPAKLHARRHRRLQTGVSFSSNIHHPMRSPLLPVLSWDRGLLCVRRSHTEYWRWPCFERLPGGGKYCQHLSKRLDNVKLTWHLQVWGGATAKIVATLRTHSAYCTNASLMLKIKNLIMLFAR